MQRRLWSVLGNGQRLDGGAMFGNAPRALWSRWCAPDERNRIPLACRALLVLEESGRRLLFETGIGAFFPPDLRARYGVEEAGHVLLANLERCGARAEDIDVVVLSHLHFDHAGGLLDEHRAGAPLRLVFPRAAFVVSERALQRARAPHQRDRASFIPELADLLERSGRLEVVAGEHAAALGRDYRLHFSDGHTPGMMLAEVPGADGPLVFAGDLVPGRAWLHAPITMGYDRCAELVVDEKEKLLGDLLARGGRLFFTHDPQVAAARVLRDARGAFAAGECWESLDGETA
ncbi:MAG: MBL fold metallo-hydrolase [Planctomycetes bacterium]|nr:MBL fold metallo-hydrolase [Planctomycetota bacterium]